MTHTVKLVEFAIYTGGRYRKYTESSGEEFREDVLVPALEVHDEVVVSLDGVRATTSSFLEEVFGGVVRQLGPEVADRITIQDSRPSPRRLEKAQGFLAAAKERAE